MGWKKRYGETLREEIAETCFIEETGWAVEQVARVSARLQARASAKRFEVLVLWISSANAFTSLGSYIYISRRLLEQCASDDVVAMIIAHEIAHHELGHFAQIPRRLGRRLLSRITQSRMHDQQQELDADRRAIRMCLDSGYDPVKFLDIYRLLSHISLDYGDTEGVFGDAAGQSVDAHSHPSLHAREQMARTHTRMLMGERTLGDGVFRSTPLRTHCSSCPADSECVCEQCQGALCGTHIHGAGASCVSCGFQVKALCGGCHEVGRCIACGASHSCRYCDSAASLCCSKCKKVFCDEHRGEDATCISCRYDALHIQEQRRSFLAPLVCLLVLLAILVAISLTA